MEYRRKCKKCGKLWCFTDEDLNNNLKNTAMSAIASIGGIASALGGTAAQQHLNYDIMERSKKKVVDYEKCPNCNSGYYDILTNEDWEVEQMRERSASVRVNVNANATTESLLKRVEIFLEDGDWATANAYCDSILDAEPENAYAYLYKLMAELKVKRVSLLKELKAPFDSKDNYKKVLRFADESLTAEITGHVKEIKDRNNYNLGKKSMDEAETEEDYLFAIEKFNACNHYQDANDLIPVCIEKAEECRIKEAEQRKKEEEERIAREKEEARLAEIERREEETVRQNLKKAAKIGTIVLVALVTILLIVVNVIIPNSNYKKAVALMDSGNYKEAYEAFVALDGYKDSTEKAESIYVEYKKAQFKSAAVGETITFGSYEQDTWEGKDEIEWCVLAKEDDRILVISKYGLDYQPYNKKMKDITWEKCTLRKWLNEDFIIEAFTEDEKTAILTATVPTDKNMNYNTTSGKATKDQIFILSAYEANKYVASNYDINICFPTEYVTTVNKIYNHYTHIKAWWLRTPGYDQKSVAFGAYDSAPYSMMGAVVHQEGVLVRPAMWIDLN